MSWFGTHAKYLLARGSLDLASADLRMALVMTNANLSSNPNSSRLSGYTLDEMDGANYARKTLAGETVTEDSTYRRAELAWTNVTWTALGNGTRQIAGALLYVHVDANATSQIPVAFYDDGCPINPGGEDFFFQLSSNGGLHL